MVKAASAAVVAPPVRLLAAAREELPALLRALMYKAVPADDSTTSSTAAAANAYWRRQRCLGLFACAATACLSRSMTVRMLDHASAGGSMDFGRSAARSSILFRLSTSALQISHAAI